MNQTKNLSTAPEQFVLRRRIGSTTYRSRIFFNPGAKETLDDKIRRLLKNELQSAPGNATMESLQAANLWVDLNQLLRTKKS